jgi:hypothetical protein
MMLHEMFLNLALFMPPDGLCKLDACAKWTFHLTPHIWQLLLPKLWLGFCVNNKRLTQWPQQASGRQALYLFRKAMLKFRPPYGTRLITHVHRPNAWIKTKASIFPHALGVDGCWVEMHVPVNPDDFTLTLTRESGMFDSIAWRPASGTVIIESRDDDDDGFSYWMSVLPQQGDNRFQGRVGIWVQSGHVAFFRKGSPLEGEGGHPWESSGFAMALTDWLGEPDEDGDLGELMFGATCRNPGQYHIHLATISNVPPLPVPQVFNELREWVEYLPAEGVLRL